MPQCPNVATTWLAARRVWRTDRSLLRSLSQTRCSRAVVFLDDTRWYRTTADSFMAVTVTLTMAASEARRLSSKYKFNWPCCALALSRRCQPSTSLLLRTLQPNTDHVDGGHTVDSSHVARMYVHSCRCASVVASPASSSKALRMSSLGRYGNASSWRQ